MIVMILGYFFEQLDNQILNFAGPNIMHSMNIATPEWASMQSMFMLGMCAGGVLGGWLSDTYGRKITFPTEWNNSQIQRKYLPTCHVVLLA